MSRTPVILALVAVLALASCTRTAQAPAAPARSAPDFDALSAQVDPYTAKTRIVVLTDIANEPDDQMSLVRFLVYANEFDVEGLVAGTSTWMRSKVRPDVIHTLIDAYAQVKPSLDKHAPGYPEPDALRSVVAAEQPSFGMAGIAKAQVSAGAERILRAADRDAPRPRTSS